VTAPADAAGTSEPSDAPRRPRRWVRWLLVVLAVVLGAAFIGAAIFVYWGSTPQQATPAALAALRTDDEVVVTKTAAGWTFTGHRPETPDPRTGLVLYPGGHVDPRAYAPLAHAIARRGYVVVVPPMPLALAFLDIGAASRAIAENPAVKTWAVGGHSLGGTASTLYVAAHPGTIAGLVLLAAYPPDGTDLSQAKGPGGVGLAAISIRGSNDRLVTTAKIDHARPLLPADTVYVTIPGGNHAQFGSYGIQSRDGTATISADAQTAETAALVGRFLGSLR